MKKKAYVSPEMEIVEIETQSIMEVSMGGGSGPGFGGSDEKDDDLGDGWV